MRTCETAHLRTRAGAIAFRSVIALLALATWTGAAEAGQARATFTVGLLVLPRHAHRPPGPPQFQAAPAAQANVAVRPRVTTLHAFWR